MPENHLDIEVIVNGQPITISANKNAPLRSIIGQTLAMTGNAGQPPENWELRDASGVLLPLDQKIESFNFPPNVRLFLNLKAGVGG